MQPNDRAQSLTHLQARIKAERSKRGFVTDPLKIFILLDEEVGEIAAELKKSWSKNYDPFDPRRLEEELADSFILLVALANSFDIDLAAAVEHKFFDKDSRRTWKSAGKINP